MLVEHKECHSARAQVLCKVAQVHESALCEEGKFSVTKPDEEAAWGFFIYAGVEMTLLPAATLILLALIFPSHHVFMEEREGNNENGNTLPEVENDEDIYQNTISRQIRKRS